MKKYKNFIIFVIVVLTRSVFLGMVKFFLWSFLKEGNISLQEIAGYISLGSTIAYLIGGSIAYSFRKKNIAIFSGILSGICLITGFFLNYKPFIIFIVLLGLIGLAYGLWLVIKSIILATEIHESGFPETVINGILNIIMLIGILLGSYWGFTIYSKWDGAGFWIIIFLLMVSNFFTLFLGYDKFFQKKDFFSSIKTIVPNIFGIVKKHIALLLPISILRAVSTAVGQEMLGIGIDTFNKVPKNSILIIIFSVLGTIFGHILTAIYKKKKKIISIIFTLIFGIGVILFPHFIKKYDTYIFLNLYSFGLGTFFGIVINILEGRYFFNIGEYHKKEYGSAAYGLISSLIMFAVMIITGCLTQYFGNKFAFFFCGIILLAIIFYIKKIDHE